MEITEGAVDGGEERFERDLRGGTGPPRRRVFHLAELLPGAHFNSDTRTHVDEHWF